jgi:NADH:ubiquinone oxidoreductase subunit H
MNAAKLITKKVIIPKKFIQKPFTYLPIMSLLLQICKMINIKTGAVIPYKTAA